MRVFRNTMLLMLVATVVSLSGCFLKKKKPPVPTQAQAPTVTQPEPPPPEPTLPQPQVQPPPPQPEPQKETAATQPKPKRRKAAKKTTPPVTGTAQVAPQAQAQAQGQIGPKVGKLVIQEGSTPGSPGQLSAGMPNEQAEHHKQTTTQLLESTQTNLKSVTRALSPEEKAMVAQIKDYMEQSRAATGEGDQVRAHNLALKAHLLSDELVKR